MKIYAEQVAPEYQESPLFYGDWPENVYTYGNRDYKNSDKIKSLLDDIDTAALLLNYYSGAIRDDDALPVALELITGEKYAAAEIRGCCQGEWINILYPAEYGREWLCNFEIEFFNMGEEWRIYTDDDKSGFYMYTHSWRDDETRAEIADAAGVDPADVVLYAFDGWTRTPNYREVGA